MENYKNPNLSIEERTADLLSRMTLEEKIKQTDQFYVYDFAEISPEGRIAGTDAAVTVPNKLGEGV